MDERNLRDEPSPEAIGEAVPESGGKGKRTRERLMDAAYEAILTKGFSGTSIDELVEAAGIKKGGFFYHFRDKGDLARSCSRASSKKTKR